MAPGLRSTTVLLAMSVLLLNAAGCARTRSDWIEETLVTVDVSGVWRGNLSRAGGSIDQGAIELTLEQSGAKVTGQIRLSSLSASRASRIDGTVNGDVFRFSTSDATRTGELQVDGDAMSGPGTGPNGRVQYTLKRSP